MSTLLLYKVLNATMSPIVFSKSGGVISQIYLVVKMEG